MVARFGVVFDLDDTLYLERDYVASGLRAVAARLAAGPAAEALAAGLWRRFESGARGTLFDELLEHHPEFRPLCSVPELVQCYRAHSPKLELLPGVPALLDRCRARGHALAVITDGACASQQAKVAALGLSAWAEPVILTDRWGRDYWKPHPRAFEAVASALELPAQALIYVADNPAKDFYAPNRLGWQSVRLRLPGQLHEHLESAADPLAQPHWDVTSVAALRDVLERQFTLQS